MPILKSKSGRDLYGHSRGTGSYSSSGAMATEGKNGVVILSKVTSELTDGSLDKLCFELMERIEKA